MEPMKPETKRSILQNNPQASPQEVDEYEKLLSERFSRDPDVAAAPDAAARSLGEDRLSQLYRKLFLETEAETEPVR